MPLRLGDVVTVALDRTVRVLEVAGFCERRGGAPEATATYQRPVASADRAKT